MGFNSNSGGKNKEENIKGKYLRKPIKIQISLMEGLGLKIQAMGLKKRETKLVEIVLFHNETKKEHCVKKWDKIL